MFLPDIDDTPLTFPQLTQSDMNTAMSASLHVHPICWNQLRVVCSYFTLLLSKSRNGFVQQPSDGDCQTVLYMLHDPDSCREVAAHVDMHCCGRATAEQAHISNVVGISP